MNALWKKYQKGIKWASLILPMIIVLWSVRIDDAPMAAFGSVLLAGAMYVMKRQGSLAP